MGGEQFENSSRIQFVISFLKSSRVGHEKEGKGNEFEFSSSSRSLGLNLRGAPVHFVFALVSHGFSASEASLHDQGGNSS